MNDHFINDYCQSLRQGKVQWVIMGAGGLEGGDEEQQKAVQKRGSLQRRLSIVDVHD